MADVLLAVDPASSSTNATGWALFLDGSLRIAGKETLDGGRARAEDSLIVARKVFDAVMNSMYPGIRPAENAQRVTSLVVEFPNSQGNRYGADSCFPLAAVAGALGAYFHGADITFVTENGWKKGVPKKAMAKRTVRKLTEAETLRVSKLDHNILDAIGIGLWQLRR